MAFTSYGDARMSICKSCEHFNNIVKTCNICGCFMPAKVEFKDQQCPKDPPKWGKIELSNYSEPTGCCGQ